jgi:hypothetical protein
MNISSKTKLAGVWWFIVHEKVLVYTKAALWFDARESLGGHPQRVLDEKVCKRLDKAMAEMETK